MLYERAYAYVSFVVVVHTFIRTAGGFWYRR